MDMPTPCPGCGEIVEFDDMVSHPNEFRQLVCESCHDRIEEESSQGSEVDVFGNVIMWKSHPDDGLIDFFCGTDEVATWVYEDDPEDAFCNFMKIWNKAQLMSIGKQVIRHDTPFEV